MSFSAAPLNDVDNVIFSILSYIDYSGIIANFDGISDILDRAVKFSDVIEQIETYYPERRYLGVMLPETIFDVAFAAAKSRRFSDVLVNGFQNLVSETENIQFSATTFILPDETVFISYRGTDDTLVGWKEDFYMAFESPVPSQIKALEYLNVIASKTDLPIRLGGHSKGGNLAVWSAVKSSGNIKKRIINVYSNDGPGFSHDFYETDEFKDISSCFTKIIPDSSVVGLMLEENNYYKVVKSSEKTFYQHNPLSWEVNVTEFMPVDDISPFSKKSDRVLKQWLASLSKDERREFVDMVFNALGSGNAKTLTDINSSRMKSAASVAHSMKTMDKESRKKLIAVLRRLISFI